MLRKQTGKLENSAILISEELLTKDYLFSVWALIWLSTEHRTIDLCLYCVIIKWNETLLWQSAGGEVRAPVPRVRGAVAAGARGPLDPRGEHRVPRDRPAAQLTARVPRLGARVRQPELPRYA